MKIALAKGILTIFILVLCLGNHAQAQAPDLNFQRFGTGEGLSNGSAICLLQDSDGFLWIGTHNGLNRYDGYEFVQFFNDPLDTNSLPFNLIKVLYEDHQGLIWVGTFQGLAAYDRGLDKWYRFASIKEDTSTLTHFDIFSIFEDHTKTLWVGTGIGLNRLIREGDDPNDWYFHRYPSRKEGGKHFIPHSSVHTIAEDQEHQLWITATSAATERGAKGKGVLTKWDVERKAFTHYTSNPNDPNSLVHGEVTEVYIDPDNQIWVGTIYEGLHRYIREKDHFEHYQVGGTTGLPHRLVKCITSDRSGNLWVGTYRGMACLPGGKGTSFVNYGADAGEDGAEVLLGAVNNILEDHSGNLWIASELGLFKATNAAHGFRNYVADPEDSQSLIGNDVFGILTHSSGEIWVASYQAGLTRIIPQANGTETIIQYPPQAGNPDQLQASSLLAISEDKNGHIWVGSFEGVTEIIHPGTVGSPVRMQTYRHDPDDPNSLGSNYIYEIIPDEDKGLWLADFTVGLEYRYQENGQIRFRRLFERPGRSMLHTGKSSQEAFQRSRWKYLGMHTCLISLVSQ